MIRKQPALVLQGYFRREDFHRRPPNWLAVNSVPRVEAAAHGPTPTPALLPGMGPPRDGRTRAGGTRLVAVAQPMRGSTTSAPRPDLLPPAMRGTGKPVPVPRLAAQPSRPVARPAEATPRWSRSPPAAQPRMGSGVRTTPLAPGRVRLIGSGQMLPNAVRQPIEAFFGADFSTVRVHHGPAAEAIGAIAFTLGEDICFAPGRYDPQSVDGLELLGHELTHVLQQRAGRVSNPGPSVAVVQDPSLEAEADQMGRKLAAHLGEGARGVLRAADRTARPGWAEATSQAPGKGNLRRPDAAQPRFIGKWWANRSLPTKLAIGGLGLYVGYKVISGVSDWFAGNGVTTVPFDRELPEALEDLRNCNAKEDAEDILARSMSKQSLKAEAVDKMSSYGITAGPKRLSNWLSGGSRGDGPLSGFRVPSEKTIEEFFVALFDAVRDGTRSVYNRSDLFHGHINYWDEDVVIIFHAKEYPSDLVDTERASNNAEQVESGTQFDSHHANFRYRNALYSFKRNEVDFIDLEAINSNSPYLGLIDQGISLDQTKLGEYVAGLNYLPSEGCGIILR